MPVPLSSHVVLVSSRFRFPEQRLLFPKARLFLDRIELSGWKLQKKVFQEIHLHQVTQVDWHMDDDTAFDVALHLDDGETVRLALPEATTWKHTLEERLRWSAPDRTTVSTTWPQPDLPLDELVTYTTSLG